MNSKMGRIWWAENPRKKEEEETHSSFNPHIMSTGGLGIAALKGNILQERYSNRSEYCNDRIF